MSGLASSQALHLTVLLQLLGGMTSLTAVTVAILSWRTIRTSARAARSSAEIAAYNSRHAELVRLQEHFESSLLFMKFWHLELATSERALNADAEIARFLGEEPLQVQEVDYKLRPYAASDPALTLYVTPHLTRFEDSPDRAQQFAELFADHVHRYEAEDVLRECFGPPHSSTSADLLTVYSLVRALCAWVSTHAETEQERAERISEITDMFRRELVLTLSRHRAFVARLFRGAPTQDAFEYFREHYGMRDDEYTQLFDGLVLDADRKGLLTSAHRDQIAKLEVSLSVVPAFEPVRATSFPRANWLPATTSRRIATTRQTAPA